MRLAFRLVASVAILASLLLGGSVRAAMNLATPASQVSQAGANMDWPLFGNTTDNTRFSTLSQINDSNVTKLGAAWTMQEGPQLATWETMPIEVGGVLYFTNNLDQVRAVNAATGSLIWQYTPKVNFYLAIAGGGGGVPTNRGVTVANGRVYLLTDDDHMISLQAATGEVLWNTIVADATSGYYESSPPTYWNGLLFVPSSGSDSGLRGFVAAYNATTGKQVWRFYMVPRPGHGWVPATGQHGGGDVWMPPTVDATTGMLYITTGNPSPDFNASVRGGCNPYVDGMVALNALTGKLAWWHTERCPDWWDFDSAQPAVLFNMTMPNGHTVRAVGSGNKGGHYWVFNAKTGAVISISPDVVYESTPIPNAAGVKVCPITAGIEYGPAAYSPVTNAIYVGGLATCGILTSLSPAQIASHKLGAVDTGGNLTSLPNPTGTMTAIDPATGKFIWHVKLPSQLFGGALATAGNLVFFGADDGTVYAFNARNGKILWHPNVGVSFGAAPMTYEVNGTQYIAVAAGGGGVGVLNTGGTFYVFKLNGGPIPKAPVNNAGLVPAAHLPSLKGLTKLNKFTYADTTSKRVIFIMQGAYNSSNSGFNFDGYSKGNATFVVPTGYGVTFEFSNKSFLPHSLGVTSNNSGKLNLPVFGFGPVSTADAMKGIKPGVYQVVGLATDKTDVGKYYLTCLVPGHAASGMWINFTISATATVPEITTTGM
ncbi:MAG TPA: PQQ-binding-like beta-propeller repeat protein [Chloroflexota bacterium]